jgi:hypothetical protein
MMAKYFFSVAKNNNRGLQKKNSIRKKVTEACRKKTGSEKIKQDRVENNRGLQ